MQHAQTVKCSTPPSLCPTLVSFLIRKRTCSNAGTEQRAVIVFWGRRTRIICTAVAGIRRVASIIADAGRLPVGDDRRFVGIFLRRTGASRLERRQT